MDFQFSSNFVRMGLTVTYLNMHNIVTMYIFGFWMIQIVILAKCSFSCKLYAIQIESVTCLLPFPKIPSNQKVLLLWLLWIVHIFTSTTTSNIFHNLVKNVLSTSTHNWLLTECICMASVECWMRCHIAFYLSGISSIRKGG